MAEKLLAAPLVTARGSSVASRVFDFLVPGFHKRNKGLDLLRTAAIGCVLLSHSIPLLNSIRVRDVLVFHLAGYLGVELFFVLSGFLIGTILIRIFTADVPESLPRLLWDFWVRRWFRTLPNYYLFLAGLVIAEACRGRAELRTLLPYVVFGQNLTHAMPGFFTVSWSLCIEEWFYITMPLCIVALASLARTRRKAILGAALLFLVAFPLARAARAPVDDWSEDLRKVVIYRLDSIAWGVLAAYAAYYHREHLRKHRFWLGGAGAVLLVAAMGLFMRMFFASPLFVDDVALFSLTGLATVCLIPWFVHLRLPQGVARAVALISVSSYSMYLLHTVVQSFLHGEGLPVWLRQVLYWTVSVGGSILIYRFFEYPVTQLRNRFAAEEEGFARPT